LGRHGRTILWAGFSLDVVENEINTVGPDAFELESQHEVDTDIPGALLTTAVIDAGRVNSHPDLIRVGVGVDPTGGAGQVGIVAGGIGMVGDRKHGYTIADHSTPPGTPAAGWAVAVLKCYHLTDADFILVEDNFGGDMVENTIRTAKYKDPETGQVTVDGRHVKIIRVHASRGKEVRAQPVASLFQTGFWHHVGRFVELQKQWTQWLPGTKPSPDRLDAEVWVATHLLVGELPEPKIRQAHVRGRPVSGNRTNRKATVRKAVR
jgi:phage terminase large subunit-like protein